MQRTALPLFALILTLLLGGTAQAAQASQAPQSQLTRAVYAGTDSLMDRLLYRLNRVQPLAYQAFSDRDRPGATTAAGRLVADLVAARVVQHGYAIGTGMLEVHESRPADAQGVITGAYAAAGDGLQVSARILGHDGMILAAHDFFVPTDRQLAELVQTEAQQRRTEAAKASAKAEGPLGGGLTLLSPAVVLDAKIIQARLAQLGYYSGKVDGKIGKRSRAALKTFKSARNLPVNDKWDMATQQAMFNGTGQ